jgi:hypothetical protein
MGIAVLVFIHTIAKGSIAFPYYESCTQFRFRSVYWSRANANSWVRWFNCADVLLGAVASVLIDEASRGWGAAD